MIENLHKLNVFYAWRKIAMAVFCMASILTANAQLSGSYTVDSSAATSGTNFKTFAEFIDTINTYGISSATTITLVNDEELDTTATFNAIAGASATNTITIDGASKALIYAGVDSSRSVIDLNGTDYMTIKNLTIRNSGTHIGIRGIWFHNSADSNVIEDNTIEFSMLANSSTDYNLGGAYIVFCSSNYSLRSEGVHGSFNRIDGNTLTTTNGDEEGPHTGISIWGNSSDYFGGANSVNQNKITNNTIKNFYLSGITVIYTNGTQVDGNDISRDAVAIAPSLNAYSAIYSYANRSDSSVISIQDNIIHDLPYKGASPNSNLGRLSCIEAYTLIGGTGSAGTIHISGNTIQNIETGRGSLRPFVFSSAINVNFDDNILKNVHSSSTNDHQSLLMSYSDVKSISRNYFEGFTNDGGRNHIGMFLEGGFYSEDTLVVEDNVIKDYITTGTTYGFTVGFLIENGSASKTIIQRNKIQNIKRPDDDYAQGIYLENQRDALVQSNLITGVVAGVETIGIFTNTTNRYFDYHSEIRQNTFTMDGSEAKTSGADAIGVAQGYNYSTIKTDIQANIMELKNWYGAYPIYSLNQSIDPNHYAVDYNMYNINNNISEYWNVADVGLVTFADYQNSALVGDNEIKLDPLLDTNFIPAAYETQNIFPDVNPLNSTDIYGNARNLYYGDLGAVKVDLDLALSSTFTLSPSICSGSEIELFIDIKNNFSADVKNVKVGYAINGVLVSEVDSATIISGGTHTYTFAKDAKFNEIGLNTLQVFFINPDDISSNDTLTFTTMVTPAPGGSEISPSATATTALYQIARPDISQVNVHTIYDFTAPRAYSNATYGTDWTADAWVETSTGTILPASTIVQRDASATDGLEVDFMTSDSTLEDETLTLKVKFTDMNNGCDTILENSIFIYPTAHPDFTFLVGICDGDAVLFENTSTVLSGDLFFEWDFGTGVATDNTDAPEPVFAFPSAGTYTVTLTAKTFPYGFEQTKTYTVVVSELPTVNFTKLNACEGNDLTFTSAVTPASAVLSWDFGDGSAPSSLTNPTHQYTSTGGYTVTLSADLNGCVREETQVAYQFDKPVAAATVTSGSCDNEEIEITNNSSIANGNFGSYWDLDDAGAVSTAKDAKHQFSTPGVKNVILTVTTDFGCEDEITIPVTVKESPKVAFTNTPACSIDPTEFSNVTPSVAGTSPRFSWNFSDGASGAENPSHTWTGLGKKTVTFNVSLDNGCAAEVSKDLSVGVQPVVSFDVADVCAGSPAVFDNQTTWPSGDISYEWDFADAGSTSTESDPVHMYSTTTTQTYVVTLTAKIAGGCEDDFTKQVTVSEGPKTCDFDFANDYTVGLRAIKLSPTGGSTVGIDYTWILGNEGSKTSADGGLTYEWQNEGPQTVTMRAKVRTTGCECSSSKEIVSSSVSVNNQLSAVVFPNPSTGDLFIKMDKAQGQSVTMTLVSLTGAAVKTQTAVNNGTMRFDANNVSNGVYLLKMVSGEEVSTVKVTLQH